MERVSKKSFIVTTLLMPILMLALMIAPALIAEFSEPDTRQIMVIDHTGKIGSQLSNSPSLTFAVTNLPVDSARNLPAIDAVLEIPEETLSGHGTLRMYTNGPSSMEIESAITSQVDNIVEHLKLQSYQIDNLDEIVKSIHSETTMQSVRNDREDTGGSTMLSYLLGVILTLMLYMCLLLYGQMVMTSIIEE